MKTRKKCLYCGADGRVSLGGMIYKDCRECDGEGFYYEDEVKNNDSKGKNEDVLSSGDVKIDKRGKSYKDAIAKIRKLNDKLSNKDAQKVFEKELMNL